MHSLITYNLYLIDQRVWKTKRIHFTQPSVMSHSTWNPRVKSFNGKTEKI